MTLRLNIHIENVYHKYLRGVSTPLLFILSYWRDALQKGDETIEKDKDVG